MNTRDLTPAASTLRKGEFLRLQDGRGRRIEALHGELWLTMDNDLRDIFIEPGSGFTVDRSGHTLISALDDATFVVLEPSEPPNGRWSLDRLTGNGH